MLKYCIFIKICAYIHFLYFADNLLQYFLKKYPCERKLTAILVIFYKKHHKLKGKRYFDDCEF